MRKDKYEQFIKGEYTPDFVTEEQLKENWRIKAIQQWKRLKEQQGL